MIFGKKKEYILIVLMFLIGIFSRLFLLEKMQSHWDGPDYSLALIHYSFIELTPTPPGYPLYIAIGKLFYVLLNDTHLAILSVSVLFAGLGSVVYYFLGKLFFNKQVGIISFFLFLTSPTIFYFGVTANPYGILPITAGLLAGVVYLIVDKSRKYGILLGLVFAFALGIRPQDAMFLTPLALFGLLKLEWQEKIKAICVFLFVFLAWFIPTANAVGGVSQYVGYVVQFAKHDSTPQLTVSRIVGIAMIIVKGFYLTLGLSGIFLLAIGMRAKDMMLIAKNQKNKNDLTMFWVFALWIIPSLFFNVFIRSDHAAHQMTYLSALLLLSAYALWYFTNKRRNLLILFMVLVVGYNFVIFFRDRDPEMNNVYVSQSYHYSEILKNNNRLAAIVSFIEEYPKKTTLILVDPEIFRPVTYYLKEYHVAAYSSLDAPVNLSSQVNHFGYQWHYTHEQTENNELFVSPDIKKIIIIPNNREYTFNNVQHVQKKFLPFGAWLYTFPVNNNIHYRTSFHAIEAY